MNSKELKLVEDAIYNYPLLLLSIKDESILNTINNYLPYSVGIEIECNQLPTFNLSAFTNIPDILNVNIDTLEQRFRIPNGLSGLICLFNICEELKLNSELNPASGHHYHIDMTNTFHLLNDTVLNDNKNWILTELDTWNYKGTYNNRDINFIGHNWIRFQSEFKTAEIRIGAMTFEYTEIVSRLIHACSIIKKLNSKIVDNENIIFNKPNTEHIKSTLKYNNTNIKLKYLINQLAQLNIVSTNTINKEERKEIINRRIIKI